ncbi:DgyrCDS14852 [Dimorphilus gyrociliatus]|uniref:DgyrCDS14852 n=1 Tax=Dimorphilus gyrociliatus TaxID=2664684 RepID=A0A7I8WFC0_9ANNE|nr:DgyrCDS14852 [Dimorphilus gyrociliatus]
MHVLKHLLVVKITIREMSAGDYRGDIAIDDISLTCGLCSNIPPLPMNPGQLSCNFETSFCSWSVSKHFDCPKSNYDWKRHCRPTPTNNTGPSMDSSNAMGYYIYMEASNSEEGSSSELKSRIFDRGGRNYCLQISYHMYGSDNKIGKLEIFSTYRGVLKNNIFKKDHNIGNQWNKLYIPLKSSEDVDQLIIKATSGGNEKCDIALDDLIIREGSCPGIEEKKLLCTFQNDLCGFKLFWQNANWQFIRSNLSIQSISPYNGSGANLNIQIRDTKNGPIFSLSSLKTTNGIWKKQEIQISSKSYEIFIQAIQGYWNENHIALDYFQINSGKCSRFNPIIYPVPKKNYGLQIGGITVKNDSFASFTSPIFSSSSANRCLSFSLKELVVPGQSNGVLPKIFVYFREEGMKSFRFSEEFIFSQKGSCSENINSTYLRTLKSNVEQFQIVAQASKNQQIRIISISEIFLKSSVCYSDNDLNKIGLNPPRCGLTSDTQFIIGGSSSNIADFPWQATVAFKRHGTVWLCGGTLIHERFVLTDADCIDPKDSPFTVYLGSNRLLQGTRYTSKTVFVHSSNNDKYKFGIVPVKLDRKVTLSNYINIACLRRHPLNGNENYTCIATGFGSSNPNTPTLASQSLLKAQLYLKNETFCSAALKTMNKNINLTYPQMICLWNNNYKQTCNGDGGSPLSCKIGNRWVVPGVVSTVLEPCNNKLSLYTQALYYFDWIAMIISQNTC